MEETFKTLREINMKLNPKKCAFGMREGTFMGYKVNTDGLKVCLDKVEAVLNLPCLKCLKDVQRLNEKLASLNRFLSKSAEKSLPFFKTLKKCTKKSDFQWIEDAEIEFRQMKKSIAELRMLTAPKEKEELIIYLAAAKEAISKVLTTKRDEKQMPVYFVSRALQGPEINYTPIKKLILALVSASKKLKRYFHVHTFVVITDQPIKQILSNLEVTGRLLKLSFELGEHDIHYRSRTSVKGQILADFIVGRPKDDSPNTPMEDKEELLGPWILFTDRSSCTDGLGVGLILTNPEGMEFTYAFRFRYKATNNEAEYEALIASLRITEQMDEKKKARAVRCKARRYVVANGVLYKRSFLGPWLRCVGPLQANYVLREIHEGLCSMHAGPRSVVAKALGSGYYWPTMYMDARKRIRECNDFQVYHPVPRNQQQNLTPITSSWPFYKWGIDIAGPFLKVPDKVKFLIVAIDYFTKVRNTSFKPGDLIYRSNEESRAKDGGKLRTEWEGPYEVTETLGKRAYRLRDRTGNVIPRTWNVCNLKKCYNKVLVVKPHFKTPYDLFRGRTHALSFMRPFGCHVTILNTLDHLGKFDGKSDEGFFVGYSTNSDGPKWLFDIDILTESMNYVPVSADSDGENPDTDGSSTESKFKNQEKPNDENSTKDINTVGPSINTASSNINTVILIVNTVMLSDDYFGANNDMRSLDRVELDISNLSTTYPVWTLVDLPRGKRDIDTKRVFRNKKDKRGIVIRNKARLVAQWCTQEEGIDYDEVFASLARIEAIRLFLAYASFMGFLVYQMDIKSAFLYGRIEEEELCTEFKDKYVDEILRKFKYEDVKPASTPMDKEKALLKDLDGDDVDVHLYRSMIGSLMYLTSSRPGTMFV
nr:reverse transcriptase domain-containing protein [Tanacetum cinerariifolium]